MPIVLNPRIKKLVGTACLFFCSAALALSQGMPNGTLAAASTLRIHSISQESGGIKIMEAELSESAVATWGILRVRNVSGGNIQFARLFAEYFDANDRKCFSLVFASSDHLRHPGEDTKSFAPGEGRELISSAPALGPASEPVRVRVRYIAEKLEGKAKKGPGDPIIDSPVTIHGEGVESSIRFQSASNKNPSGVRDLALALVAVNAGGEVREMQIIRASDSDSEAWIQRFVRKPGRFQAATSGFLNKPGEGLIILRSVDPAQLTQEDIPVLIARRDPWVESYVKSFTSKDLPSITQVLCIRSATELENGSAPVSADLIFAGSDWSQRQIRSNWNSIRKMWELKWAPNETSSRLR
jgi:hypothetical protein